MKDCEYCKKKADCRRDTGMMFGGCNVEFEPDRELIYKELDNLEGCKDNPVYAKRVTELRAML